MVHSLTITAVKLKMNFDPPAKMVNCKELCCAIGVAYKQANIPLPEFQIGENIYSVLKDIKPILSKYENIIDPKLIIMIASFCAQSDVYDEDCKIVMQLGYNNF